MKSIDCKCRKTAWRRCPWAVVVTKVDGGFIAFDSHDRYMTWRGQK